MKTTIKRFKCIAFLTPWERAKVASDLHRRATRHLRAGVALLAASCAPFLMNAALWVIEAGVVALMVAGWLLGRAWFLASRACKYEPH